MFQVRIHGRGGQGAVTAAELLSVAAFVEGKHAQAFPSFGSERTGAPVVAFCRIDDRPIRVREPVVRPDALIVQDSTLLGQVNVFDGLVTDGYALVNSTRGFEELVLEEFVVGRPLERLRTVPATRIALHHLGRPVPNAALLGGLAALSGCVSIDSLVTAIEQKFSGAVAKGNAAAAREVHAHVRSEREELTRA